MTAAGSDEDEGGPDVPRLLSALARHGVEFIPIQLEGAWLARMEISTWRTDAGDFDLLADMPGRDGRHIATTSSQVG